MARDDVLQGIDQLPALEATASGALTFMWTARDSLEKLRDYFTEQHRVYTMVGQVCMPGHTVRLSYRTRTAEEERVERENANRMSSWDFSTSERELEAKVKTTWSLAELTALVNTFPIDASEDGHVLCDLVMEQALRIVARTTGQLDEAEALIEASDKIGKWYA